MIPLSDVDRRPVQYPAVTAVLIAINSLVFALELIYGQQFMIRWSFVPSEIFSGQNLVTLFTAMFMHGGWLHIVGNMLYLWAFGPEIEDAMGRARYLVFYVTGGLFSSLSQVIMTPHSSVPSLGASGAIAAVMGAFMIMFPHDRIRTILFIGFFVTISFIPAMVLVGLWFLIQLISEAGVAASRQSTGIAYVAHIGGFLFGMAIARFLMKGKNR